MYVLRHLAYVALVGLRKARSLRFWLRGVWIWLAWDAVTWLRDSIELLICKSRYVECECCGWRGRRFFLHTYVSGTAVHRFKEEICPRCESLARQRQLVRHLVGAGILRLHEPVVLDIGPGKADLHWLNKQGFSNLVTVDLQERAMARMDITHLGFKDSVFDVVICSHVLEHVPDDVSGAKELLRVLKPEGLGLVQVPLQAELDKTVEYGAANGEEFDHVRKYGQDFATRFQAAGIPNINIDEGLFRLLK